MSLIRRMNCDDMFRFNNINLDALTETYAIPFYLTYFAKWPSMCLTVEGTDQHLAGYIIGKAEGRDKEWKGHVSAITVAAEYRRLGIAKFLMEFFEKISDESFRGYFVDLYVRMSNHVAVNMYKSLGYTVYRQVIGYYGGGVDDDDEDAYDMRKALSRDPEKLSMVPLPHPVYPGEND